MYIICLSSGTVWYLVCLSIFAKIIQVECRYMARNRLYVLSHHHTVCSIQNWVCTFVAIQINAFLQLEDAFFKIWRYHLLEPKLFSTFGTVSLKKCMVSCPSQTNIYPFGNYICLFCTLATSSTLWPWNWTIEDAQKYCYPLSWNSRTRVLLP